MASLIKDVFHEITRINHVFISALCANDAVHAAASCVVTLTQFRRMMSSSIIGEYTNFNAYEGTLELCSNGIHLKPVVYRLLCSSLPIRLYVLWASTANWWVSSNCGPGNRQQLLMSAHSNCHPQPNELWSIESICQIYSLHRANMGRSWGRIDARWWPINSPLDSLWWAAGNISSSLSKTSVK